MAYTREPLTPTSVNKYIKNVLEGDKFLRQLYITGELSNVKYHSNGNIYFSVKDDGAQINCIMFKSYKETAAAKFVEGEKVEILGNIYAYTKMGQYSINVVKMRKVGLGDLHQKYTELKNRLEAQGYFGKEHKKQIPKFPERIGVITSPTGAAVRDVITTIQRRHTLAEVVILPTLVQGEKAYKDVVRNIQRANEIGKFDVLIVGRGGGSIEDLWAFNEMEVAQSIYDSKTPIISAVGHETDFTIADFVADVRAPTPTAAAEMATPNSRELVRHLQKNSEILQRNIQQKLKLGVEQLRRISENQYFNNPLLNIMSSFDYLTQSFFSEAKVFEKNIIHYGERLEDMKNLNEKNIVNSLENKRISLEHQKQNIDNLNPLSLLSKGYTMVQKNGKYIKSVTDIKVGDDLEVNLRDGEVKTKVIEVKEKNE